MTTHSNILAWRIPRTEEPGTLQSIELHRLGHDGGDFTHTHYPPENCYMKSFYHIISNVPGF